MAVNILLLDKTYLRSQFPVSIAKWIKDITLHIIGLTGS